MRLSAYLFLILGLLLAPAAGMAEDSEEKIIVRGQVSVAGKYDSNVDLISKEVNDDPNIDDEIDDAWITEISTWILVTSPWNSPLLMKLELYGLADLHVEAPEDSWALGRGNLEMGYKFGKNTLSISNESAYFTEPDDTDFDNYRNSAAVFYKRTLSDKWQAKAGYINTLHLYTQNDRLDHMAHGGLSELQTTWDTALTTYYRFTYHQFQGLDHGSGNEDESIVQAGRRMTGEIGFESFFKAKNFFTGSYAYQSDKNDNEVLDEIGEIKGEDESLESDDEFNNHKHKGMLLFHHRFNDRFSIAFYEEFIHKTVLAETDEYDGDRVDLLFCTSSWFNVRLWKKLYAKTLYLYRMNDSTYDRKDFQDHIGQLGLVYRFY